MRYSLGWSRPVMGCWLMWLCWVFVVEGAHATERPGQVSKRTVLAGYFPARISFQLKHAMKLAAQKLIQESSCRAIFSPLTSNPMQALELTSYHLAGVGQETQACQAQGVVAYTTVGGHRTHLCPPLFEQLNTQQAAVVLIHEALHRAGLNEWPPDPNGLTSAEINLMVQRSCNL